jgi:O-antigen ligase
MERPDAERAVPFSTRPNWPVTARLENSARILAIFLGFSIPVSTALDNWLLGFILLLWLGSGGYQEKRAAIRANPVALAALALLGLVLLGLAWSTGPLADGLVFLRKYSNLLLIPIFVTLFKEPEHRRRGLLAFAAAIGITLILSIGLAVGLVPSGGVITGDTLEPTVFKTRIVHNLLMAFACLLFAELARTSRGKMRLLWIVLMLAAVANVMLMVKGRTGHVVLAGLVVLYLFSHLGWKGLVAAAVLVAVGFGAAYSLSDTFRNRLLLTRTEAAEWRPDVANTTSIGVRLEFYRNTLTIIREHPLIGVGTGGFLKAYADQVQGSAMVATHNPHNLYLLITVQFGAVGLVLLLYLFFQQWRSAPRLPTATDAVLARGVVVILALGGLFNSLVIDHAESLFFAWASGLLFAALPWRAQERL